MQADRILWSHICHEDRERCTDPEAHFTGSDEQWSRIVEVIRERDRLRNFARKLWHWAGPDAHRQATFTEAEALGIVEEEA